MALDRTTWCRTTLATALLLASAPGAAKAQGTRLQRIVDELLPRVEQLSGLPALAPLNVGPRSRTELRAYLEESVAREVERADYRHAQIAYRLLGLIPDSVDLETLVPELLAEQIAGYYDHDTDTLYILDDVAPVELRAVVAHEITHALQDQHFRLDSLITRDTDNDVLMATRAAAEGHATLVMLFVQLEELLGAPVPFDELPDFTRLPLESMMPGRPSPAFASAPRILRESGAFPYGRGLGFVHALRARDSTAVPFRERLPASTEQVVDPYGHFIDERDEPTRITFDDAAATAPWSVVYENSLGMFELSVLLMERHRLQSESIAGGWDGDRYRLLADGSRHALEWFIVWDDARAASRFVTAYTQILRTRMGRSASVETQQVEGRAVVRIIEADEGIDLATLPRSTVRLSGN